MHAIDSSFRGLLQSETKGESCKIRVMVETHKPLRRGVFCSWWRSKQIVGSFQIRPSTRVLFRMWLYGSLVKNCLEIFPQIKELPEDDMPYSLTLRAEYNFSSKLSLRLGEKIKNLSLQWSYMGEANFAVECEVTPETKTWVWSLLKLRK